MQEQEKDTGVLTAIRSSLRSAYRWINEMSPPEEIAHIYTIITVANSVMMITGWDQPKEGSFAYLHLLIRLAIITFVVLLWEYEEVLVSLRTWIKRDKEPTDMVRPGASIMSNWMHSLRSNHLSTVSILFTALVALVCAGVLVLQGVLEPAGGIQLYRNLLVLYAATNLVVLCFSMIAKRS